MSVSNLADIIMKELIPFYYYYDIPNIPNIPVTHESTERYLRFVINSYISKNNENFINVLKSKNDIDFIKELNIHFAFYNKQTNDMTLWLSHTEKLIKKNINDRYLRYAFDEWLNTKRPIMKELEVRNEIFLKLIGLIGNHNNPNTIQPVYYYINDLLKDNNLNPIHAIEIVLQMAGSVSPDWNKNVIPFIIDYLKEIQTLSQPQQIKKINSKNSKELNNFSYKPIAIAYCILGVYLTAENAEGILKLHSKFRSVNTLLKNRIEKPSVLTKSQGGKTANTKHLMALNEAKRLLKGMNKKVAVKTLSSTIIAFQVNSDKDI